MSRQHLGAVYEIERLYGGQASGGRKLLKREYCYVGPEFSRQTRFGRSKQKLGLKRFARIPKITEKGAMCIIQLVQLVFRCFGLPLVYDAS